MEIGQSAHHAHQCMMSIVVGNFCFRQFCSSCCKIEHCYLEEVEEIQDAEYIHRARPAGSWQIGEDAEFEGNLLWLN